MMENIKNYSKANKFVKSITNLLVGLTTDKNDLQVLKAAFKEIDDDNNGMIQKSEFE